MRIFLSCVSGQFLQCRQNLASDLRALGHEVKVQEDFQQGGGALIQKLQDYIDSADRVILIVGDAFGMAADDEACPATEPQRSYTQWECFFATGERLDGSREKAKAMFVYVANADYLESNSVAEPPLYQELQERFVNNLLASGIDRSEFGDVNEFCRLALRDLDRAASVDRKVAIPASLGSLFRGREHFIQDLRDKIKVESGPGGGPASGSIEKNQVITGLGGVGKTRLAVEYAHQFGTDYNALLFVLAETPEVLSSSLANLVGPLALDITEVQDAELEQKVAAAMRWLIDHPGWLLIVDNVDSDEAADAVESLVSKLHGGHVLITSRLTDWSAMVERLDLDVIDEKAAAGFLLDRTARSREGGDNDESIALRLVNRLGNLALALEQAGAFIASEGCSIAEYLELWEAGDEEVYEWYNERLMNHYPRSAATTWKTSMESVGPCGFVLMRLASLGALSPLPSDIFLQSPGALSEWVTVGDDEPRLSTRRIRKLLNQLSKLSMLNTSVENGVRCISMHRVVADITNKQMDDETRSDLYKCLQDCICNFAPDEADRFENWDKWDLIFPHCEVLIGQLVGGNRKDLDPRIVEGVALYNLGQEKGPDGVGLQRIAVNLRKEKYGDKHPSTLLAMNDLAIMVRGQEGVELLEAVLPLREEVHGEQSEEALETAYNLAMLLPVPEHIDRVEQLYNRCFEGFVKLHGRTHWRTLMAERGIRSMLFHRDRIEEAIECARRIVQMSEAEPSLGPLHKDTLQSVDVLGLYLSATGDRDDAIRCFRRSLEGKEAALGARNAETLGSLTHLVNNLYNTGKPDEAIECCRSTIKRWSAAIGAEHDHTIQVYDYLINMLAKQGRVNEAYAEQTRARKILNSKQYYSLLRQYGHKNVCVLLAEKELADSFKTIRDYEEAEKHYLRSIDGLKALCGKYSEDVAIALNNYGLLLRDYGKLDEALDCYAEALEIDESIRPAGHSRLAHRKNNLALVHLMRGDLAKVRELTKQAWEIKQQSHDITSARVLWARTALAFLENEDAGTYIGQLRRFVMQPELTAADGVDTYWEIERVIRAINGALSKDQLALLEGVWILLNGKSRFLVDVSEISHAGLNEESSLIDLNSSDMWNKVEERSLDEVWPA